MPSMAGEEAVPAEGAPGQGTAREASHGTGEVEDTVDPLTGIPSKWAEFWRATNRNASISVVEESLSDGYGTLLRAMTSSLRRWRRPRRWRRRRLLRHHPLRTVRRALLMGRNNWI